MKLLAIEVYRKEYATVYVEVPDDTPEDYLRDPFALAFDAALANVEEDDLFDGHGLTDGPWLSKVLSRAKVGDYHPMFRFNGQSVRTLSATAEPADDEWGRWGDHRWSCVNGIACFREDGPRPAKRVRWQAVPGDSWPEVFAHATLALSPGTPGVLMAPPEVHRSTNVQMLPVVRYLRPNAAPVYLDPDLVDGVAADLSLFATPGDYPFVCVRRGDDIVAMMGSIRPHGHVFASAPAGAP